jgi:Gas vesicle protein
MSWKSMIFGACVGAGVALLFAPARGSTTRAKIRDKAVGMGHDVQDYVEGKSRHISNKMEGYKAKARGIADRVQNMMGSHMESDDMAMAGEPTI